MPRAQKIDKDGKIYELVRFIMRCDICDYEIESKAPRYNVICMCGNLTIHGGIESNMFVSCIHDIITDLSEWTLIK